MTRLAMLVLVGIAACSRGPLTPVPIDTAHDTCENCRMIVSDARFAAEIVARGEEPLFFDDLGCLQAYQHEHPLPQGAVVFVVDHRTGGWIDAGRAVYSRVSDVTTPMGSRIVAEARR